MCLVGHGYDLQVCTGPRKIMLPNYMLSSNCSLHILSMGSRVMLTSSWSL